MSRLYANKDKRQASPTVFPATEVRAIEIAEPSRLTAGWVRFSVAGRDEARTSPFSPSDDVLTAQFDYTNREHVIPAITQLADRCELAVTIVDAGMRQLVGEGWVHNRVRMLVASFLVKDLHLDWTRGAAFFMEHLVDADVASNQHGWQWVAGTGTDAAPYFRVFNPTLQGTRFDPGGTYVRRWVAELAEVSDRYVHHPWDDPAGPPEGYPAPIVDHFEEKAECLRRYQQVRNG